MVSAFFSDFTVEVGGVCEGRSSKCSLLWSESFRLPN